jgi:hypothetical protein
MSDRKRRDAYEAAKRGGEVVDCGTTPDLDTIRRRIAEERAKGATIVGCSFCARYTPRREPMPCPVCDTVVYPVGHRMH